MLSRALRELGAVRRELREVRELIKADVRTADRLVGVREACEMLGVRKTKIYAMIARGELPARKDGKSYRFSYNQLQKYINH